MKILLCHSSLGSGGIESMVVNLANQMSLTQDVTVCTIFQPKDTDVCYQKLSPRVKFISLGKTKKGITVKLLFSILQTIRKGCFDVIHLNGFFYYYFLAVIFLHKKTKFFYTVHNDAVKENCMWDKYLVPLKKFCFRKLWMHAVTISKTSQKSFVNLYDAPNTLIYNGVSLLNHDKIDISYLKHSRKTRIILNPARISEQKNQLMLCKVMHGIIEEGFDCCLIIAGANNDQQIYSQLEPYFCDRIKYLGERSDTVSLMSSVDAMCLSSKWEGMPVTLIEALSVGCIPICTPVGGINDVIQDGKNGILSSDISEDAYYNAIKRFMSMNCTELHNLSQQCKISFSQFDIKETSEQYLNLFKQTI